MDAYHLRMGMGALRGSAGGRPEAGMAGRYALALGGLAMKHAWVLVAGLAASSAMAQPTMNLQPPGGGQVPKWVAAQIQDPDDPRVKEYAQRQKRRVELEKELFKLRAQYFRNIRNTEIRQIGIHKLREYTQPVLYESLLKIFKAEGMDVRGAVLDILAEQKNDEADTVLAWAAIFDDSKEFREAAQQRLQKRIKEDGVTATARIKSVIAEGLRTGTDDELGSAAHLAAGLGIVEAIPMLISAQLGGQTVVGGGSGDNSDHSLAWIEVGTQQAFVSGLTPVVGDSAVAFDPTVSVVTDGVYLRVIDAVVVTYRYEVHNALVDLSSKAWGQRTDRLGWDNPAWRKWYTEQFVPDQAKKAAEAKADSPDKPK
jgi:hypothetical protein